MSAKPNKFRAEKVEIDGILFASKAEGRRYQQLKLLEQAGEITNLTLQERFPIIVGDRSRVLAVYKADFSYFDCRQKRDVIEDVKGYDTPLSKFKRKLVAEIHGVEVEIVRAK